MFITLTDVSKGKPFSLKEPINNPERKLMIGIRSIKMWVGYFNISQRQVCRWGQTATPEASTEVIIEPGLYNYKQLTDILQNAVENLSITVNPVNGIITMIIPSNVQLWLTEPIRYLLGLDDTNWLTAGEYEGDHAVEFLPKRILVYLKQLTTTYNFENNHQKLEPSQLLGVIPTTSETFGECATFDFERPHFKHLQSGSINELDFDFKMQWSNGDKQKLDNHSQPIDLVLEII